MIIKLLFLLVVLFSLGIAVSESFAEKPDFFTEIPFSSLSAKQINNLNDRPDEIKQAKLVRGDMSVLGLDNINVKLFGNDFEFKKDRTNLRGNSDYTWFGSNQNDGNMILVVNDNEVAGFIQTQDKSYMVYSSEGDGIYEIQEIDYSKIPPEHGTTADENTLPVSDIANLSTTEQQLISQLESFYVGGRDYSNNKVPITVYVVFTEEAENEYKRDSGLASIGTLIRLAIEKTNDSYNDNHLPLELVLADTDPVRGYVEGGIATDLANLKDPNNSAFARTQAVADSLNADVVVLITKSDVNGCGQASEILSSDTSQIYAVVGQNCAGSDLSFAHEVGHLQGAGHNKDFANFGTSSYTNSEFSYGHGWYDVAAKKRTIMSYDCDNSNVETCVRQGLWSDPYDSFFASASSAGTETDQWNAKVLFATAPYIASLRGTAVTYDDIPPTGAITISPSTVTPGSTITITATFDEEMHPNHTPKIILNNNGQTSTSTMTKSSNTVFTTQYTAPSTSGTVNLSFSTSDAFDIFGNPIVATPTSGSSFNIIIPDNTPPVITPPSITVKEATAVLTPVTLTIPTVTDNSGETIIPTNNAPSTYPIGITTVTWTAIDSSGNPATATQTVIITDTTDPVITVPTAITSTDTSVDIGTATATDIFPVTITNNKPSTFPIGDTIVTWTATDSNGKFATATQLVTITDGLGPVFTVFPVDITTEATAISTPVNIGTATATDDSGVTPTITNNSTGSFSYGTTIVTWSATDATNNKSTMNQSITITDTTNPIITVPTAITSTDTSVNIGTATATDIFPVTITNNKPSTFPIGDTIVTWTATDSNGKFATGTQIITISGSTPPVTPSSFTGFVPSDITIEASNVQTPLNIGLLNTTSSSEISLTTDNNGTSSYPVGTSVVSWTVTVNQIITILDTTDPTLTIPPDITSTNTSVNIGTATATDIADPNPIITNNATTPFSYGTTIVTWSATDASGNSVSQNQMITIINSDVLNETFDTNIDGWQYFGSSGYAGTHSSEHGGSLQITGDSFSPPYRLGMQKTVDISQRDSTSPLYVSFDYRATSDHTVSVVTNAEIGVIDSNDNSLFYAMPIGGGTTDSGWVTYVSPDLSALVAGQDTITLQLKIIDAWIANYHQKVWFDNVKLGINPPSVTSDSTALSFQQISLADIAYDELSTYIKVNGTASLPDYLDSVPLEHLELYQNTLDEILIDLNDGKEKNKNSDKVKSKK